MKNRFLGAARTRFLVGGLGRPEALLQGLEVSRLEIGQQRRAGEKGRAYVLGGRLGCIGIESQERSGEKQASRQGAKRHGHDRRNLAPENPGDKSGATGVSRVRLSRRDDKRQDGPVHRLDPPRSPVLAAPGTSVFAHA